MSKSSDNKRYLILTYRVKYDTVNYPLPLQFAGKMSTAEVEDNVAKLQDEIDRLKTQIVSVTSPYKRKHASCCSENAELKKHIDELRGGMKDKGEQANLVKTLQNALHNLESDMIREKNKYQRALDKKGVECRKLVLEVENLRTENRALTVKLRSVTTELNVEKRNKLYRSSTPRSSPGLGNNKRSSGRQNERNRSGSRQSSFDRNRTNSRQSSFDRNPRAGSFERNPRRNSFERNRPVTRNSCGSRNTSAGSRTGSVGRGSRAGSVERSGNRAGSVERSGSRAGSVERSGSRAGSVERSGSMERRRPASTDGAGRRRGRTPSPGPRFDPSAYVRDKQRRIEEARSKKAREARTNTYLPRARSTPVERRKASPSLYHNRPPSGVVRDIIRDNLVRGGGSCSSAGGSEVEEEDEEEGRYGNQGSDKENNNNRRYLNNVSNLSFTKDSEIAEIDARLDALQTYLKDAQVRNY
eukprot:sb/3464406/